MSSAEQPEPPAEEPSGQESEAALEADGPGVLGSLPRSRPSVRSPRRGQAPPKRASSAATPRQSAEAAEAAEAGTFTDAREPAEPTAAPAGEAPASGPEADLERLARAGLSVAGGAAALGLRAAGRAAAALRDAVERR